MTFLIADGVVPSNEDRGYVLRRLMRRAIQQGHRIGIEQGFLPKFVDVVTETMGAGYPELAARARHDPEVGDGRGGGLRPHARAGPRLLDELLAAGELAPTTPSGCTTRSGSRSS